MVEYILDMLLKCDQPLLNAQIRAIKSIQSARERVVERQASFAESDGGGGGSTKNGDSRRRCILNIEHFFAVVNW